MLYNIVCRHIKIYVKKIGVPNCYIIVIQVLLFYTKIDFIDFPKPLHWFTKL